MKKFTFVMRCDGHATHGEPNDSYTALVEASDRVEAAKLAKAEITAAMKEDDIDAGTIHILIVFEGHPKIDGFGFQTGKYER